LLEGFYHWITCAETHVGAAIRKQHQQGLRLTLALAMAHEHLIRFDKACYHGCAAAGMHVGQTALGAFDAAGWWQQNRGFLAMETDQAYLVALLIGVEWTLLCFPGACRLGLCRVRRPPGLGLWSSCPQGLTPKLTCCQKPKQSAATVLIVKGTFYIFLVLDLLRLPGRPMLQHSIEHGQ
jgi:hypothetical protein